MKFKLKNNEVLGDIYGWIKAENPELNSNRAENIKIALGEVLQNIIRHGYKNILNNEDLIDIECQRVDDKLIFLIKDYAKSCEPELFLNRSFVPNESGHMGLSIIRKLTDEFTIKPLQDGNETKLIFNIGKIE